MFEGPKNERLLCHGASRNMNVSFIQQFLKLNEHYEPGTVQGAGCNSE